MKKKDKEIYCNFEYFMQHGCRGCKRGRKCEEWDNNRTKRNSINRVSSDTNNSGKEKQIDF